MRATYAYTLPLACAVSLLAGLAFAFPNAKAGEAEIRRATQCLERGDTLAAIHALEHSHLARHTNADAAVLLGRLWRERGGIESRVRSQRVLEDARRRFPGVAVLEMELGLTYFAQRFYPDAVACFQRALALEPRRCDARFMLGLYHYRNWQRMNEYGDDLADARRQLRDVLDCDAANAQAAFMYLAASYAMGDTSTSMAAQLLRRFPDRPEFHFYRGVLAYDAGDYDTCADCFAGGLALLPGDERRRYSGLDAALPIRETDAYAAAPPNARAAFTRGYWLSADPDPTTATNERELEHLSRMFLADLLFSVDASARRGHTTDRGQTFVKFGRPAAVDYTLGGHYRDGKVETWSYFLEGSMLQFTFVDEFLNGNPRIPYLLDFTLAFMKHAPQVTSLRPRVRALPAGIDVTVFRDGDLESSLYVAMRIDADTLRSRVDMEHTNRFVLRGACFDPAWTREGEFADTIWAARAPEHFAAGTRAVELVRRVGIPFERYHVAWAFEDERAAARAVVRADADAARFAGDGLALSDVLLFDEAGGAGVGTNPGDAIERGGLRMRPRVGRKYAAGERVHAYVEVYNLAAPGGESEYDIRFGIYPASGEPSVWELWSRWVGDLVGLSEGEPAVAQQFRRRAPGHESPERMTIDIDRLDGGSYRLVIDVTDLTTGERSFTQTRLWKEGAPVAER